MNFIKEHWKYLLGMALVVAVLVFGYMEYKESKSTVATPVVKTKVTSTDTTAVSYVPKVYPRDSDVEITKAPPKVTASFNGTQHTFDAVQGETQKFDKGKLVVDQSSTLTVDVSAQVEKQVEQGIAKAFKEQAKKPRIKLGIEGGIISADGAVNTEVNLRISRQSEDLDIDVRVGQSKQSLSVTKWF